MRNVAKLSIVTAVDIKAEYPSRSLIRMLY